MCLAHLVNFAKRSGQWRIIRASSAAGIHAPFKRAHMAHVVPWLLILYKSCSGSAVKTDSTSACLDVVRLTIVQYVCSDHFRLALSTNAVTPSRLNVSTNCGTA